jgi:hypothetical protein
MPGVSRRTILPMIDHACELHDAGLDRLLQKRPEDPHDQYDRTASDTIRLLASRDEHTAGRGVMEGHLRCIGCVALSWQPGLQQSFTNSNLTPTSLQPPPRPANQRPSFV